MGEGRTGQTTFSKLKLSMARMPFRKGAPSGPVTVCHDPWHGDAEQGARLVARHFRFDRKDYDLTYGRVPLTAWPVGTWPEAARHWLYGFSWLRDLRALGSDEARLMARKMVGVWIANPPGGEVAEDACTTGMRLASWLSNHAFCLASADHQLQKKLMDRVLVEARTISALLPLKFCGWAELSALRGLLAAALAIPEQTGFMVRFLRYLPSALERILLPDGMVAERSPQAQYELVRELAEISMMFRAAQLRVPPLVETSLEKAVPVLRALCHGDGGLAVFNGSGEGDVRSVERVLAQGSRLKLIASNLTDGKFTRVALGKSLLIVDGGGPPIAGADQTAHAGTCSFEFSHLKDRIFVNCGSALLAPWAEALRASAAHNVLIPEDLSSSDFDRRGRVTRRPVHISCHHQTNGEGHWIDLSHDGYHPSLGATWKRQLYLGDNGEDLRGQDVLHSERAVSFVLRFHLHPNVIVTQDDDDVIMHVGEKIWRFRQRGGGLAVEPDVYLARDHVEPTRQIVVYVDPKYTGAASDAEAAEEGVRQDDAAKLSAAPPSVTQTVSWLLERIPE
ncbi:heparinase II/III family protein [Neokomagataea sp. TBRC 2177]|uniref:Heparinase II/III family protein n=2 Tax=Neokomagataea anthophila TaxID=2826925 RepID=A0ABS5E3U1_9PROT|nr:heparinase II/III family protein [Neokomagataea anthophila]